MMLNEASASGTTICPQCGFPGAMDEYDKKGGFEHKGKDYQVYGHCYLCGWTQYGDNEDEAGLVTIDSNPKDLRIAKKISKIFKKANEQAKEIFVQFVYDNGKHGTPDSFQSFARTLITVIFD